jgi:hypothetical protein
MGDFAPRDFEDRLAETLRRTVAKVGPEAGAQLAALIDPTALAIMAGILIAWIVSHAFGVGEIIDILISAVGLFSIGFAVFTGLDHLYDFASGVYHGKTMDDLEKASAHLAKAIAILGVQAVLAVLFRGAKAPRTAKGGRLSPGAPPPRTPGLRFKPTIRDDPALPAGEGSTSFWGNIKVSAQGAAAERALVLLHEKVHQFLTPKLYLLRGYRVSNRASSYMRSSLWRYIEEALAETIAQVGVNGFKNFFQGIRFPVDNGYMYLKVGGGYSSAFTGSGFIPEAASLLYNGVVSGIAFELWILPDRPPQAVPPGPR